ncbi:hypothetical protein [Proteiniphilum sp.]|uniref:hypothetical protein n=1 Tax=Proteiniphilum sp. TaxID=1926877 RepID=UPI002B204137|nr:hypothetical protein [Proteiniphilum sp.]MEA4919271.1 hypothetical protein [Proteiniphilum sp.]
MKKKVQILVILLSLLVTMNGQVQTISLDMPKIVPTSPEAASLTKMVNYPVSMSTGVPDIHIPVYEIQSAGLVLPIDLQYHAGGFKINEQASRAGLGWSLSSELQITRTVNGLDDLLGNDMGYMNNNLILPDGYKFTGGTPFPNANMYNLATGKTDGQPDKFDYKLLNKSGSFFILKTGSTYKFVPTPYDNIKIELLTGGAFRITDTDGTIYYFERQEVSHTPEQCITAWKCTRILNNLGKEVFAFSYTQLSSKQLRSNTDYVEYYTSEVFPGRSFEYIYYSNKSPLKDVTLYNDLNQPFYRLSNPKYIQYFGDNDLRSILHLPYYNSSTNTLVDKEYPIVQLSSLDRNPFNTITSIDRYMLTEITFHGGKVKFNPDYRLDNIQILQDNNIIKSVRLYHSFANPTNLNNYQYYNGGENIGTPYLDSLIVTAAAAKNEKYSFLYNSKFCFGSHLAIHDAWGYPTIYTTDMMYGNYYYSVPRYLAYEKHLLDLSQSDIKSHLLYGTKNDRYWIQSSDNFMMDAGVLRRIIYPTGGYVDFDYEPNQYLCPMPYYFGDYQGLKYADLIQYCGGLRIRSINYYDKGSTIPVKQKYYKYGQCEDGAGELNAQPELNPYIRNYSSILGPMADDYSYKAVMKEEYVVYIKEKLLIPPVLEPDRSHYTHIMTDKKLSIFPASMLEYTYENGSSIYYTKVTEYNSDMGVQTGKTVYEFYTPRDFDHTWNNRVRVYDDAMISYIKTPGLLGHQKSVSEYKLVGNKFQLVNRKSFEYEKYVYPASIQVAAAALNVLYSIIYESGGAAISTDARYYNNNCPALTDISEYKLASYSIPILKLLLKKETEEDFDSSPALTKTVSYTYNRLQPSEITTVNSNGYTVKKALKYSYDFDGIYDTMESKNMISQVVEERHTQHDEFLCQKNNYGMSADAGGIVPVSIEKSYNGSPTFIETTFDKYDQYGNILQMTGVDKIPVSFLWGYGGLYPVAQITGIPYSLIPESFKNNSTINSPSSDDALRTVLTNLRNNINTAMVESYTYKKLVGMSSKTESNGSTTYFDYDDFGRLIAIKDNNKKLVEGYEYKYTQPEAAAFGTNRTNIPYLYTETVMGSSPVSYNKILKGGVVSSGSPPEEISRQLIGLNRYNYDLPADSPSQLIKLTLEGFYYPSAPNLLSTWVEIELYKDNQTKYSKKVRFDSIDKTNPDNKEYLFVLPGEYSVVVKSSGSNQYSKSNVLFCYFATNTSSYSAIPNLSKINLVSGNEYKLKLSPQGL